jgi:hypothetical protein
MIVDNLFTRQYIPEDNSEQDEKIVLPNGPFISSVLFSTLYAVQIYLNEISDLVRDLK